MKCEQFLRSSSELCLSPCMTRELRSLQVAKPLPSQTVFAALSEIKSTPLMMATSVFAPMVASTSIMRPSTLSIFSSQDSTVAEHTDAFIQKTRGGASVPQR